MIPDVFVANEQDEMKLDEEFWVDLAKGVLGSLGVTGAGELSVLFVDEAAIAGLNERFMNKTGPTDVLSFPIDLDSPSGGRSPDGGGTGPAAGGPRKSDLPYLLGDVVICPKVALAQCEEHQGDRGHDGSFDDEVALLLVHGILHLRGMDHEQDEEAEVMEAKEDEILTSIYRPLKERRQR